MNYQVLAAAQRYYSGLGYINVEVPWLVEEDVNRVTAPPGAKLYEVDDKVLVASAEQSFIQFMKEGRNLHDRMQAITPCFRNDPVDELHQRYFMKLELYRKPDPKAIQDIIDSALVFFSMYTSVEVVETEIGYDIVDSLNKIELGSYGARQTPYGNFVYGTGVAEPRLSYVLGKQT